MLMNPKPWNLVVGIRNNLATHWKLTHLKAMLILCTIEIGFNGITLGTGNNARSD